MARKKDSRALFELISKSRERRAEAKLSVPEWMGRGGQTVQADQEAQAGAGEPSGPPPLPGEAPVEPPAQRPAPAKKPPRAAIAIEGNRVTVCLTPLIAAVVGVGAVVVLLGSFLLGRLTAPAGGRQMASVGPAGQGDGEQGPEKTPSGGRKEGDGPSSRSGHPAEPALKEGSYYLVIQTLQGTRQVDLEDARDIQKFCAEHEVPAKVMRYTPRGGRTRYMVWSLKPFDLAETTGAAASKYAAEIEVLGRGYSKKTNGRYSFSQGRDSRGNVEGWFLPYRKSP